MPRIPKPFRERPNTLKEMEDSLAAWDPALEEYNRRLREFDSDDEKRMIVEGRVG
jgi:hypothetical protein